jgi:hypothetical protein
MEAAQAKNITGKKSVVLDKDLGMYSGQLTKVGWTDTDIPDEYKVKIVSALRKVVIIAVLQESFDFTMESDWVPMVPISGGSMAGKLNELMQFATHKTLVTRFTSRRIWQGTTPVSITLTLIFESLNDSLNDVLRPVKELLALASPGLGSKPWSFTFMGKTHTVPLLEPPGPTPFSVPELGTMKAGQFLSNALKGLSEGDHISLAIGTHFEFSNVIVKRVMPKFDSRMDVHGYPIKAEVTVVFETYEIMTKEAWDDAIY